MRSLVLIAAIVAACYYYYGKQHPGSVPLAIFAPARPVPAAAPAATPVLHYHSPLDADNSQNSSGYFSSEPAGRYETTGPKSTASGRAALLQAQAQAQARAAKPSANPADPDDQ